MKQFYIIDPGDGRRYMESDIAFTGGELNGSHGKLIHYSEPSGLLAMVNNGMASLLKEGKNSLGLHFFIDEGVYDLVDFDGKNVTKEPYNVESFHVKLFGSRGPLAHFWLVTIENYGSLYDYFREKLKFSRVDLMQFSQGFDIPFKYTYFEHFKEKKAYIERLSRLL